MKKHSFYLHSKKSPLVAKCFLTFVFSLLIFPVYAPAYAIEEPRYTPAIESAGPTLRLQLGKFLEQNYKSDIESYMIFDIDLNGDGLLEYILKRKNCGQYTKICTFLIIADRNDGLSLLSEINARHIMIGDGKSYGIKNILAFKNQINAYDFDIYMWSPREKMYTLNVGEIRN